MVTICTTSLTFNNSTFCPYSVFMCFVWIWEQTAIISLYNINWLVFITETVCVYSAVRTESVCRTQGNFSITARAVIHMHICPETPRTFLFLPPTTPVVHNHVYFTYRVLTPDIAFDLYFIILASTDNCQWSRYQRDLVDDMSYGNTTLYTLCSNDRASLISK